jgi:hypothetical protein
MTFSDLIGYRLISSAIGEAMAAWWSTKWRTPAPSKKAMPQPSWWVSVRPPRWAKPVKLKTMSVGTLQFMASNWHMGQAYHALAAGPVWEKTTGPERCGFQCRTTGWLIRVS